MSDSMVILNNLGIGDAILASAIVRHYAKTKRVIYCCYFHNLSFLSEVFGDANIVLHPIQKEQEGIDLADRAEGSLKLGWYNLPFDPDKFDQEFYRQAGLEFNKRWDEFKLPEMKIIPWDAEYSWCHDDESRGFTMDRSKLGISPHAILPGTPLRDIVSGMYNATEIHVINSSMLILADSVATPRAKRLVLHHYARKTVYPTLRKNWEVI